MTGADLRRLELVGLATWRVADELRDVRHALPVPVGEEDRLARQARELEELARTVAGECAARLREAQEGRPARGT